MSFKLSVITPVLNAHTTVERTIRSVLSDSNQEVEYILVDGGSTDGTLEIISRYAEQIAHIEVSPDRGISHALNKGIGLASGEYIAILNADDWYPDGGVSTMLNLIQTGEDFYCGAVRYVDPASNESIVRYAQPT